MDQSQAVESLGKLMSQVHEIVGAQPKSSIPALAKVTGFSKAHVAQIMNDRSGKKPLDVGAVLTAINTLQDGEVVPYGELAAALGSPHGAQAVGGIVRRAEVPPEAAARVIPTGQLRGAEFAVENGSFRSHAEPGMDRHKALEKAGVPHRLEDDYVLIAVSCAISRDQLRARLQEREQDDSVA